MNSKADTTTVYLMAMLDGMRPSHWIKNIFIFAAMPFGGKLLSQDAWFMSIGFFMAFCGLASAVYLINDVKDRNSDRLHPEKRKRAIASGRLPVSFAVSGSILLIVISMSFVYYIDAHLKFNMPVLSLCGFAYIIINIFYTFWAKNVAILDIILISMGFVVRAVSGAIVIRVPVSTWLIMCTFMLSLFMSIAKRRSEINEHSIQIAKKIRNIKIFYTHERVEHMLAVAASLAIMSYSLYCVSPEIQERIGSVHLVWTIPFVVYGIFRYYCLSGIPGYGDPVQLLLKDKVIWLTGIAWILTVIIIIRCGKNHLLNIIFM